MKAEYILGVDGGNTKTHYFLYDGEGNFVDCIKAGTCSHEALPDSYVGTGRELDRRLTELFSRNKIRISDIAYAVFGLAGADFEYQKQRLSSLISELGFKQFIVENDGFLGLKAGSRTGIGICCINGTGTVTVGINERGERLQSGGLGEISTDRAGAHYIALRGIAAIYDMLFRCGKKTSLKDMFYKEYDIKDDADFPLKATEVCKSKEEILRVNKMMERAEAEGDTAVKELLTKTGEELARTVFGCAERLQMVGDIEVILAGSVWTKGHFETMYRVFTENLEKDLQRRFIFSKLKQPPVIGAVIWALEEYKKYRKENPISACRERILGDEALLDTAY